MQNPFDLGFVPKSTWRNRSVQRVDRRMQPVKHALNAPWIGIALVLATFVVVLPAALPSINWEKFVGAPGLGLVLLFGGVLIGGGGLLAMLSLVVAKLRGLDNKLYWETACWALVAAGIGVRQLLPNIRTGEIDFDPGLAAISCIASLAVFPVLMRWLNKTRSEPGLVHVAFPFALGFFLDLAQVLAIRVGLKLPWDTSG